MVARRPPRTLLLVPTCSEVSLCIGVAWREAAERSSSNARRREKKVETDTHMYREREREECCTQVFVYRE